MHDCLFFYWGCKVPMHVSDLQSTLGQSRSKAINDLKQLIAVMLSSSKLGLIKNQIKFLLAYQKSMFLVGSPECMKSCNMKPRSEHISRGWQLQFPALIPVPPFVHNDRSGSIHRGVSSLSRQGWKGSIENIPCNLMQFRKKVGIPWISLGKIGINTLS